MRSIQFANHLVNDVQQLLSIADVFYQRFVLRFRGIPIHAMHGRIVETIFHRAPGVAKHLGPFGGTVNFHAHGKVDPATCALGPTGGATTCSCGACAWDAIPRQKNRAGMSTGDGRIARILPGPSWLSCLSWLSRR